jgi:hypothetical protein
MTIWHDDDSFWELFAPFIFHEERLSGTAEEIDLLMELIDLAPGMRVASPLDLLRAQNRSKCVGELKSASPASAARTAQSTQTPPFLENLPLEGEVYDLQQLSINCSPYRFDPIFI